MDLSKNKCIFQRNYYNSVCNNGVSSSSNKITLYEWKTFVGDEGERGVTLLPTRGREIHATKKSHGFLKVTLFM